MEYNQSNEIHFGSCETKSKPTKLLSIVYTLILVFLLSLFFLLRFLRHFRVGSNIKAKKKKTEDICRFHVCMVDSIAQNKCTREWNEDKAIKVSIKVSHTSMALNGNTIPLESCRHRSQTKQRHAKMNWHTHTQPRTNTHTHTQFTHTLTKWINERTKDETKTRNYMYRVFNQNLTILVRLFRFVVVFICMVVFNRLFSWIVNVCEFFLVEI